MLKMTKMTSVKIYIVCMVQECRVLVSTLGTKENCSVKLTSHMKRVTQNSVFSVKGFFELYDVPSYPNYSF